MKTTSSDKPRDLMGILAPDREVSWGWGALDRAVGPLVRGRLHVVGAKPSNGKTSILLSLIDRHARRVVDLFGLPTGEGRPFWRYPRRLLAFLTERSPQVARASWAARQLGYSVDLVLRERWDSLPSGAAERVARALQRITWVERQGWVRFVDASSPTIEVITKAVERHEPHILMFDYLQRIRPARNQSKLEALGELIRLFELLTTQADMLVIASSQLGRRGQEAFALYRPPHLEDFKGSGEIEESADLAIGLYRHLTRMTAKQEREVRAGHLGLDGFVVRNSMLVKVVKHRYWGEAADRRIQLWCDAARIADWTDRGPQSAPPPLGAGDAWESEDSNGLPF